MKNKEKLKVKHFKNFSKKELKKLFVKTINEMESTANNNMKQYVETNNDYYHIYGAGLLTYAIRAKFRIIKKNTDKHL